MATPKKFTDEFKAEAVKLSESSKESMSVIAKELGIALSTLHYWRIQAKRGALRSPDGKAVHFDKETELLRLKRDNERLKRENEILKKAAAFFAKESF